MASSRSKSPPPPSGKSAVQEEPATEPHWKLAKKGISLIINNKAREADELFKEYPESIQMYSGYSYAVFMDALMSFEEDKLNQATAVLKDVEKRCTAGGGWFKSVRKAFYSPEIQQQTLTENLETQIILADSLVCLSILTFLQQDISGYFKGGWVLRKAWKAYESAYREISTLYKEIIGELPLPDPVESFCSSTSSMESPDAESSTRRNNKHQDLFEPEEKPQELPIPVPNNGKTAPIDKDTIKRLMAAVSFGYGLFQLGISLLPPSLLKLTNFLGFGGNRSNGIACLMYARKGVDMRSPLATLSLLWYHTIVRPFYALDGTNVQAGVDAASLLLEESQDEYGESSLFLFFKGRIHRLNSDIPQALQSFQSSVDNASQREIRILSLHEVGWCHLIQLDYCSAETTFGYLKSWSRWSRGFYSYIAGICTGACELSTNLTNVREIKENSVNANKLNQLDSFLTKRAKCCPSNDEVIPRLRPAFYRMLVFEMLYLWNALASCSRANIAKIITECQSVPAKNEPMIGLAHLILGSCYSIQKQKDQAIDEFRICLELRKSLPTFGEHAHVSAFAQYEIGSLLIKSPQTKEEGRIFLQQMNQYKDYDFEQRLNVRVHSMLKNIT